MRQLVEILLHGRQGHPISCHHGWAMGCLLWGSERKLTVLQCHHIVYLDGLVQERRNSSALAMELRLSCTNPSICFNTNDISYKFVRYVCTSINQSINQSINDLPSSHFQRSFCARVPLFPPCIYTQPSRAHAACLNLPHGTGWSASPLRTCHSKPRNGASPVTWRGPVDMLCDKKKRNQYPVLTKWGWHFVDNIFEYIFFDEKVLILNKLSSEFVLWGSIDNKSLYRRQAIEWTNDDAAQWQIHASPGLNGLRKFAEGKNQIIQRFQSSLFLKIQHLVFRIALEY